MRGSLAFSNWPLRVKLATLLVVASLLPLAVAAVVDIREARARVLSSSFDLLAARGDQLVGELDTFHRIYVHSAEAFARLPGVIDFCVATSAGLAPSSQRVRATLDVPVAGDSNLRGAAILDLAGKVAIATEPTLVGKALSFHAYVRAALQGGTVISDIHLAEPEVDSIPTIAYLSPVRGPDQKLVGILALWVQATALWEVMKASNELAGSRSFAVLFDQLGIRTAHTYSDDIVFHPGGPLEPSTVAELVAERRFGPKTRELLEDIRAFPDQFERSRADLPDQAPFRGFAPVNQKWNYGVGRRFQTVPWTVFYMIPEESLQAQTAKLTREKSADSRF